MFDGFLADSAKILTFEAGMDSAIGSKFDIDFSIFRPQGLDKQVDISFSTYYISFLNQVALLILTLGEEDDPFINSISLKEIVLPYVWHSFCISIDIGQKEMLVTHNGKVEANQPIQGVKDSYLKNFPLLRFGKLGGTNFVGSIAEFEVFAQALPLKELLQWTTCQIKG